MKDLGISGGSMCSVIKVSIDIEQCIEDGIDYSGKYNITNMGIPCVISINSVGANIIANSIKTVLSLTFTHTKVNESRRKEGADFVSYSAIIGCYNRMTKVVNHANKRGAGSRNADTVWTIAWYQ